MSLFRAGGRRSVFAWHTGPRAARFQYTQNPLEGLPVFRSLTARPRRLLRNQRLDHRIVHRSVHVGLGPQFSVSQRNFGRVCRDYSRAKYWPVPGIFCLIDKILTLKIREAGTLPILRWISFLCLSRIMDKASSVQAITAWPLPYIFTKGLGHVCNQGIACG